MVVTLVFCAGCGRFGFETGAPDADASTSDPDAADGDGGFASALNAVFVTRDPVVPGNLGSPAGADEVCQGAAESAGLDGVFIAWLAGPELPLNRLADARGWVRTDGRDFADRPSDLVLLNRYPPRIDQNGDDIGETAYVVTGFDPDAPDLVSNCEGWSSTAGTTNGGWAHFGPGGWMRFAPTRGCSESAHLVCFGTDRVVALEPPGEITRAAFVSGETWRPVDGISSADELCTLEADGIGLPGSFRALLATTEASALGRFAASTVWQRLDATPLAGTLEQLSSGEAQTSVSYSPGIVAAHTRVWTGAQAPGALSQDAAESCNNWSSSAGSGSTGFSSASGQSLFDHSSTPCGESHRVYCLQE